MIGRTANSVLPISSRNVTAQSYHSSKSVSCGPLSNEENTVKIESRTLNFQGVFLRISRTFSGALFR